MHELNREHKSIYYDYDCNLHCTINDDKTKTFESAVEKRRYDETKVKNINMIMKWASIDSIDEVDRKKKWQKPFFYE